MYIPSKNEVLRDGSGKRFRVLRIDAGQNTAHVIGLDDAHAVPRQWSQTQLQEQINSGKYSPLETTQSAVMPAEPVGASLTLRDYRWGLIEPLLKKTDIFIQKGRKKLLQARAAEAGCSTTTLMRALRLYWQGGMSKDALVPNFDQCGIEKPDGSHGGKAAADRKVRGRHREDKKPKFKMTPQIEAVIWERARTLLGKKKTTRPRIYKALCKELWSHVDANNKVILHPVGERPSARQVNYVISKHHSKVDELRRQSGPGEFRNDYEAKLGNVLMEAIGVGHQYEMDSTIVDLWIVAKDNRNKIIGKPTLYIIVDRYSRLVVGYHLTLDKPSWAGAKEAILSLVEGDDAREARAKRLGVPWRPQLHPARGLMPAELVLDRGSENIGHDSDRIAEDIETSVISLPAHFARGKSVVECKFRTGHVPIKDLTAGYQPPSQAMRRHGDRYEHDAEFTLDECEAELYQSFELHNERMHPGMARDTRAVLAGIPPVPVQIWEHDKVDTVGTMRRYDWAFMQMKLLHHKRAVVTQQGIRLNGLFYTCKHAEDNNWFILAGKHRFSVQVSYDRRLTNTIFVHDRDNPRRYYEAQLTPAFESFRWKSHAEAAADIGIRKAWKKEAEEHNLQLDVQFERDRESRAASAKLATQAAIAAADGQSRTSNTKEVRQQEIVDRRVEIAQGMAAVSPRPPARPAQPAPASAPQPAPIGTRPAPAKAPLAFDPLKALMEMNDD